MSRVCNFLKRCQCVPNRVAVIAALLLPLALYHFALAAETPTNAPQISHDVSKLPQQVQRMRLAILQAAVTGNIEELRLPIDMNELHPVFTKDRITDPIAYLKTTSADGQGREMLAILYNLLTSSYAVTNPGTKEEMVVWPAHAALLFTSLTPQQEFEIYRFLPPQRVKEMLAQGKYSYYRVGIGKDGVWHYFTRD